MFFVYQIVKDLRNSTISLVSKGMDKKASFPSLVRMEIMTCGQSLGDTYQVLYNVFSYDSEVLPRNFLEESLGPVYQVLVTRIFITILLLNKDLKVNNNIVAKKRTCRTRKL